MPAKLDQDARPDEKLLKLYSLLLFTGKEYSLTELKDKLMCSKQTIGRLVDKLEKSYYGSIVVKKKGKENFYSLKKPSTSTITVTLQLPISNSSTTYPATLIPLPHAILTFTCILIGHTHTDATVYTTLKLPYSHTPLNCTSLSLNQY